MIANTAFLANEALFNLLLARYVTANGDKFGGSKIIPEIGLEFVFGLNGPPTTELGVKTDGSNITLHFDQMHLDIYTYENDQRGALQNTLPVHIVVAGTLALSGQSLQISELKAAASGTEKLDAKVAAMFNDTVIPQFQAQVANLPLPDFKRIVGLPVQLNGLQVVEHQLQVSAQIGGSSDQPSIPSIPSDVPIITASLSSGVINELAGQQFPGAHEHAGNRSSKVGFGYDGEADAGANGLNIKIAGGQAHGSLHVWASAKGGIELFGKWVEPALSVSTRTPPINLRLVTGNDRKSAVVKLYLDGNIQIDFGLPGVLEKVADSILSAIRPLSGAITDAVNIGLDKINIPAFTLPNSLPGTNLAANLKFDQLGLYGNSVFATIHVS
jgi:hypothetical protein